MGRQGANGKRGKGARTSRWGGTYLVGSGVLEELPGLLTIEDTSGDNGKGTGHCCCVCSW